MTVSVFRDHLTGPRVLGLLLGVIIIQPFQPRAETPNVVVILTDDQGYADLSYHPEHRQEVFTPNIDMLAADAVFFTQAYTSGAVCSPTRAGLMLGRYQQRVGIYTAGDGGRGFDPNLPIFPSHLPPAYRSTAIGKWHLGLDQDYPALKWHAMNRGFSECYKFMGRGGHDYFELKGVKGDDYAPIYRNKNRLTPAEYQGYLTTRLTEEAVAFIHRSASKPFFLYLAYNAVHAPAQAPKEDIERIQKKYPQLSRKRAILMAMLQHLDQGVGSVVEALKKTRTWDNTLLFFLTDNGGAKAMEANNGSLRGYKGSLYEGGIRTPMIVSWPAKFKGDRRIHTPVISLDILPTVLNAIENQSQRPDSGNFDGKSLLPLLTNSSLQHHEMLHWASGGPKEEWAIRKGQWKLHGSNDEVELFNLVSDPSEKTNLAPSNSTLVASLLERQRAWEQEMQESARGQTPADRGQRKQERRNRNRNKKL